MEFKIFRCEFMDGGLYTIQHIIAESEEKARQICRDRYHIRKNAKNFEVCEIKYREAIRYSKTKNELVSSQDYRPGLGTWDTSHWSDVTHHYCSHCGKQVDYHPEFCPGCGSYFTKYEER